MGRVAAKGLILRRMLKNGVKIAGVANLPKKPAAMQTREGVNGKRYRGCIIAGIYVYSGVY